MFNWKIADSEKIEWVHKFKDIFINQKTDMLGEIFVLDSFGLHNGLSVLDYAKYEFNEFSLKSNGFGLTPDALISCYEIGNEFIYFALGKKSDKALFESFFKWDNTTKKVRGNQYLFRIEPKMQFIKKQNGGDVIYKRRINIKSVNDLVVKRVINHQSSEENEFVNNFNADVFGGNYCSLTYSRVAEDVETYWENIDLFTNKGMSRISVLMRGVDHPLFVPNIFPEISSNRRSVSCQNQVFPVILSVMCKDGSEYFFKYPQEKKFEFNSEVEQVCLTDTLSFDWIVQN